MSKNMKQNKKEIGAVNSKKEKMRTTIPLSHKEGLPYYDDIRMSWVASQMHCEPNNKRGYYERGISFGKEWIDEIGWLRYYIFNMENGYAKGKSKLVRIEKNKGFYPSNCLVIDVEVNKKKDSIEEIINSNVNSTNITNYFMLINNDMKPQEIIKLLKSVGGEYNEIIPLSTFGNEQIALINEKH